MDPLSHVSFGRLIVHPAASRLGRGAIVGCMIGSIAPDVDLVVAASRWDVYLRWHQAGTHSLAGAAICGIATGVGLRATGIGTAGRLSIAATLGCMGHLFLDYVSGADVKLLWPLSPRALTLPLFAMADPWLLVLLIAAAIAVARCRTTTVWAGAIVLLLCVFLAKGVLYRAAIRTEAVIQHPSSIVRAEARWGSWTRWLFFQADATVAGAAEVSVSRTSVRPLAEELRHLEDPMAIRSMEFDTVRNFLASHSQTFARIDRAPDGTLVLWSDLRYCRLDERDGESPDARPLGCAVWFGGEFDSSGRARAAVGRIGRFVQRRVLTDWHATHEETR
jgi:inner membrane protein